MGRENIECETKKEKKKIFTWEIAKEEKIKCCRLQEDSQGELCEKENEEEKKEEKKAKGERAKCCRPLDK